MKKLTLLLIASLLFIGSWFAYEVQPWDNALLTKIYDRIDAKFVSSHNDLLAVEQSMDYIMLRYGTSDKNTYFLEKIQNYLREKLYRATDASVFVCLDAVVQNNDTVTISYSLMTEEWITISLSKGEYTMMETTEILFNPGNWQLIEWINEEVLWLSEWKTTWVAISHRDAYGWYVDWLRIVLPRQAVEQISQDALVIDQRVHMNIELNWKTVKKEGFIKEIGTESVLVDFNEPLAWHWILWTITVESLFKNCN